MTSLLLAAALGELLQSGTDARPPLIDFNQERMAYRKTITTLFESGQFAALEDRVKELRQKRPRFTSGAPMLYDFYAAFNPKSAHIPEDQREAYAKKVLSWGESHQSTLVGTMAALKVHEYYAWKARGPGTGAEVSASGARTFVAESSKGWALAEAAEARKTVDAALYEEMLRLCKALERPRDTVDALFEKAIALDPAYDNTYVSMAAYLLPRWHGS